MRRYDDPVEVRRGWVDDAVQGGTAPEQFLWRGRLWKVRAVLASWTETGAWWASREVDAVLGTDTGAEGRSDAGPVAVRSVPDLLGERELWRVEAGRGASGRADASGNTGNTGVFELSYDYDDGRWALVGCAD
ncbi:hypothetical protein BH09ACT12_BH09ACT12_33510 [soil metagenome]